MLDSAKIIDKNVYNFLKNKNGLEWLKIYQNIEKNNDSQPNKLNLVRYLNKKGCSYYSWLYQLENINFVKHLRIQCVER